MRKGTWLRPMVLRVPMLAHYLPGHELNEPVLGGEAARCGRMVYSFPPGAMRQDWRAPWSSPWTCKDCVEGLQADEEGWRQT